MKMETRISSETSAPNKTLHLPTPRKILILSLLKGKEIPLQALTGPESFRRLRLPDF
jgi:hypothetical protein